MQDSRFDLIKGFQTTPTLDVFEDETTIPRRKKRRSSARRVSFAETKTVHVFQRDDEYATPPGATSEVPQRRSPRLAAKRKSSSATSEGDRILAFDSANAGGVDGDMDTGSSTDRNAIAFGGPDAGDEAAGPVDINHIMEANQESPFGEDDITLDSTTFSEKFSIFSHNVEDPCKADDNFSFESVGGIRNDENSTAMLHQKERPGSWESDMSFTVQQPRRPPPSAGISPPASFDRSLEMQYTEMVDAAKLAQRRRRIFRTSPGLKGNKNLSPMDFETENIRPKKLRLDCSIEKEDSSLRKPLQDISSSFQKNATQLSTQSDERHTKEATTLRSQEAAGSSCSRKYSKYVEESYLEESHTRKESLTTVRVLPSLDFLLDGDTDSQIDMTGKTTPVPTLRSLLDRDTCVFDTTIEVDGINAETTSVIKMPPETVLEISKENSGSLNGNSGMSTKTAPLPSLGFLLDRDTTMFEKSLEVAGANVGNRSSESETSSGLKERKELAKMSQVPSLGVETTSVIKMPPESVLEISMENSGSLNGNSGISPNTAPLPSLGFLLDRDTTMFEKTLEVAGINVGNRSSESKTSSCLRERKELTKSSQVPSLGFLLDRDTTVFDRTFGIEDLSVENGHMESSVPIKQVQQFGLLENARRISVAEFSGLADIQFRTSNSDSCQSLVTKCTSRGAPCGTSLSLLESLKFVCLTNPLAGISRDVRIQLKSAVKSARASVAEAEIHLSENNPPVFTIVQTMKGRELYEIQKKLRAKLERQRNQNIDWLQLKLDFENEKSCCLKSNKEVLVGEAEAFRFCYKALQMLHGRCRLLQNQIASINASREDKEALDEETIFALRKENQESRDKIKKMKEKLNAVDRRIQDLSLLPEIFKSEHKKNCFLQKMQGWHITMASAKQDLHRLDTSYGYRMNQSISIEGKGPSACAWINLAPNFGFIEKGFPHINAALFFQSLLPGEKFRVKQVRNLPAAMQQTSDVVMNLVQVAKEAGECRVQYRCLDSVMFFKNSASGMCLQFAFENYRMRLKVTLLFQLQHLSSSGEYPKDIVPSDITVEFKKRTQNVVTEQDLRKAISSLHPGYHRFHRVCACVSSFFL